MIRSTESVIRKGGEHKFLSLFLYGVHVRNFILENQQAHDLQDVVTCLSVHGSSQEERDIVNDIITYFAMNGVLPFQWTQQEQRYIESHDRSLWHDYVVYRYKMSVYPQRKIVAKFPTYLLVEPVSACNLRCVMCFQVDKTFTKKPYMGVMDFDTFKNVVDQAHQGGTSAITMASRGEPTLHPRLGDMLDYASGKFFDLKVNTNATKLTEELAHRILSSGLTELVFSIEADEAQLYEKIRIGGKFNEVLKNIERFRDIKLKHYPDSKLITTASGVFFKKEQDVERYSKFWSSRVDMIATVECESRWDTYGNPPHPDRTHPCEYLWERAYIWWDGRMNPCDVDYKSNLCVGDMNSTSISEIWHGDVYTRLREDHLSGRRDQHPPCDRCGI